MVVGEGVDESEDSVSQVGDGAGRVRTELLAGLTSALGDALVCPLAGEGASVVVDGVLDVDGRGRDFRELLDDEESAG